MKVNGTTFDGTREEVLVIPRGGHDVVFKAKAIEDMEAFEKICPSPVAGTKMLKGGLTVSNTEDPAYQAKLTEWAGLKTAWMVIESLKATEGLEWDTVTDDPATWPNYSDDLRKSGFSDAELGRLIALVSAANGLNQSKITEATERFLVGQEAARKEQ